jgi:hypothetical protein
VAGHYAQLSFDRHIDLLLVNLEVADMPDQTPEDREARELILMRTGEALRDVFDAPALAGHLEPCRFGLIIPGMSESTAESLLEAAAAHIESACSPSAVEVRFRISELNPGDDLEELLAARELPACDAKTVMLAD